MLSLQYQRQINIVPDRKSIQKVKILEYKSQIISPETGQLLILQLGNGSSAYFGIKYGF